ncbi:MAG: hypothetical protein KC478_11715, partial [Bacteriovoracaceae bacterium]|nr:hypothetical protein [Bacteriovoracaceae bacterium]
MTDQDTLLLLTDPAAKQKWRELAAKSLKGLDVEKVLNTKTVEGIEYKGLYTQGTVMPELTTYPKSIAASRIYDSGLVEESDLKEDYEQGMHGCVLMVEGKSWKSKFSKSVNPTFILQRNSDDLISQFENPESVF